MEFPDEGHSGRTNCVICGIENIHKNNYDSHINGKKHIYNERKLSTSTIYKCESCNKVLTDRNFFKIHLASNAHKINIRKLQKLAITNSEERKINTSFRMFSLPEKLKDPLWVEDVERFSRKKYKIRPDSLAFEQIESYVYSVVSYLSVKLALDHNVKHFLISINDKRYKLFGDIVIFVMYKEESINYAIRCKQISTATKNIENLKEAKIDIEKEYNNIDGLSKLKDFDITKFLIFTTCNTTSNFQQKVDYESTSVITKLNIVPSNRSDIINVSKDSDSILLFKPEAFKKSELESEDNKKSEKKLPRLFLYTNQRVFPPIIDELLKKRFDNHPSIYKDYMKYIENWEKGALGGNYMLNKKDVILKLGELLLEPYIILPKMVNFRHDDFTVWNDIIEKIDVIIVKTEPFILSKLCEPFNQTIENVLKVKFDSITKTVNITEKITDSQIKSYLFEEIKDLGSDIHLSKIYRVFWKAGQIPLLMSLRNNEDSKSFIFDVISFMKTNFVKKKFLIKSEEAFQFFKKPPDNLEIFSCLEDVKEYTNLDSLKIKVFKEFLSVEKIKASDPFFLRWITPSIFFDMVLGRYTMRAVNSSEANLQNDLKIILDEETKADVQKWLGVEYCQKENLGRLKGINPNLF